MATIADLPELTALPDPDDLFVIRDISDATNKDKRMQFSRILEQGTWTPIIRGITTAGSPTIGGYTALYTRIGTLVVAMVNISLSNLGGMAGQIMIGGLPFAIPNVAVGEVGRYNNLSTNVVAVRWEGNYGNGEVMLTKTTAASASSLTALNASDLNNNSSFRFMIKYFL